MKKFSDFSKETLGLVGRKIPIADTFNKTVVLKAYRIFESKAVKDKQCLQLQLELEGEDVVVFCNSGVLIRQVTQYADEIPFETTIRKSGSYYTFS